jgi:pimeloyl-ACP methyl ester carboxylesterase
MLMVPGKLSVLLKMVTPRRYNDAAFRDRVVGEIYGGSARAEGGPARELVAALMRPTSKRGYLAQLFAITGWSSLPWLPMLRQRTLVMAGTDDPIIRPINARLMARLLPRSTLKFFDDGHLFVLSDARQASAAVSDFLSADPAAQGKPLRPVPT